jgi:predicted DNA binding CopG/RHH family protein
MKSTVKIPKFKSNKDEKAFWQRTDSSELVDWTKGKPVSFTKLKPTLKSISLRLPEMVLEELKMLANKRDIPYQSLLKQFLCERITQELKARA